MSGCDFSAKQAATLAADTKTKEIFQTIRACAMRGERWCVISGVDKWNADNLRRLGYTVDDKNGKSTSSHISW